MALRSRGGIGEAERAADVPSVLDVFGLEQRSSGPDKRLIATAILACALIVGASVLGLRRIERNARSSAGSMLDGRVEALVALLEAWGDEEIKTASFWAAQPEVERLTVELLDVAHQPRDLLAADAQQELRDLLAPVLDTYDFRGYFIVAPDGISLSSTRDANTGTTNLVAKEQPGRIGRMLSGEATLTAPQFSDVPLVDASGVLVDRIPTMFVGAPVMVDGQPVAVLMFRIDVSGSFQDVFDNSEWGTTGELVAVDTEGRLLTESRFNATLADVGLIDDDSSFGTVQVVDPRADLTDGGRPAGRADDVADLEPTLMAAAIADQQSGRQTEGYRSYLGYEVLGAWRWIEPLGYGVAAEQAEHEVLTAWMFSRRVVLLLTATGLTATLGLAWFLVWVRPRLRSATSEAAARSRRLHAILDQSSEGLVLVDENRRILFFNQAAEALFGYDSSELIGQDVQALLPPTERARHGAMISRFLAQPTARRRMAASRQFLPIPRKDGTDFPGEVVLGCIELEPGRSLVAAVVRDMTSDVNLRLARQTVRELERLTTVSAHHLAEPLRKITMFSSAMLEDPAAAEDLQPLLVHEVERMRTLVDDVGRYASLLTEHGESEAVDLAALVREVLAEHGLGDGRSVSVGDLPVVSGRRRQLALLVDCLVDNAVKYRRPDADLHIEIAASTNVTGAGHDIAIEDRGLGFAPEHAERIFDLFDRLGASDRRSGNGIGLALVRWIAEAHGGSVVASPLPQGGSRFVVTLPSATGGAVTHRSRQLIRS